jgi:hypothetical protein
MKRTLLLAVVTVAISGFGYAATYNVKITDPVVIDGKELKPGDYKIELKGDEKNATAVIRGSKDSTEVKVRTETNTRKYDATTVRYNNGSGKNNLDEIHIGGTKTKLIFDAPKAANGGA